MRRTRDFVLFERQLAKLWNDLAQCSLYPSQSRALCLALRFRDALEESLAEWVAIQPITANLVRMLQKLGNKMKIGDGAEIVSKGAKLLVGIGVFQIRGG